MHTPLSNTATVKKVRPPRPMTQEAANALQLTEDQRRGMLALLGITEAEPPVTALDGKVLVVCPGSARAPQVGMVCPWTALTYGEFLQIRERGIVNNEGEQVMPPFEAWGTTNESGTGRAVIHFEVPAMLEYLREWNRVAAARRAARREGEGKLAVVSRQSSDIPCNFPLPTAN